MAGIRRGMAVSSGDKQARTGHLSEMALLWCNNTEIVISRAAGGGCWRTSIGHSVDWVVKEGAEQTEGRERGREGLM